MNKEQRDALLYVISAMRSDPVTDYVLPGLTSTLLARDGAKVRLFESNRNTDEFVIPHSHRFDFACLVLKGHVHNRVFHPEGTSRFDPDEPKNRYVLSDLRGRLGEYSKPVPRCSVWCSWTTERHDVGEVYFMRRDEIHSISFSQDATVLFFEGPTITDATVILEPEVYGVRHIPTFDPKPWMFQRSDIIPNPTVYTPHDGRDPTL